MSFNAFPGSGFGAFVTEGFNSRGGAVYGLGGGSPGFLGNGTIYSTDEAGNVYTYQSNSFFDGAWLGTTLAINGPGVSNWQGNDGTTKNVWILDNQMNLLHAVYTGATNHQGPMTSGGGAFYFAGPGGVHRITPDGTHSWTELATMTSADFILYDGGSLYVGGNISGQQRVYEISASTGSTQRWWLVPSAQASDARVSGASLVLGYIAGILTLDSSNTFDEIGEEVERDWTFDDSGYTGPGVGGVFLPSGNLVIGFDDFIVEASAADGSVVNQTATPAGDSTIGVRTVGGNIYCLRDVSSSTETQIFMIRNASIQWEVAMGTSTTIFSLQNNAFPRLFDDFDLDTGNYVIRGIRNNTWPGANGTFATVFEFSAADGTILRTLDGPSRAAWYTPL